MTNQITIIEPAPLSVRDPFLNILFEGLSDNSKRQYQHTMESWRAWCDDQQIAVYDLSAVNVLARIRGFTGRFRPTVQ